MAEINKGSILVVDDEQHIREFITCALKEEDYHVESAENGLVAIKYLEKKTPLPHLILLDIKMPVMDGFEFLDRKRTLTTAASIPVVVTSASEGEEKYRGLPSVVGKLKKPFDLEDLVEVVGFYVGRQLNAALINACS